MIKFIIYQIQGPLSYIWITVGVLTLIGAATSASRLLPVRRAAHKHLVAYTAAAMIPLALLTGAYSYQAAQPPAKLHAATWAKPAPGAKVIYLTFDDGPDPASTPYILSVLEKEHVPASFFDIGKNILNCPSCVQDEFRDGMVVGDHTWSHPNMAHQSDATQEFQVQETSDLEYQLTGYRPQYLRFPYGSAGAYTESHLAGWGMKPSVYWTYAPGDWAPDCPGAKAVESRLLANAKPGAVFLLHDSSECGGKQLTYLPATIKALKARGYTFALISQDPAVPVTPVGLSGTAG